MLICVCADCMLNVYDVTVKQDRAEFIHTHI